MHDKRVRNVNRSRAAAAIATVAVSVVALAACGDPSDPADSDKNTRFGAVEVSVATSGGDIDDNGYGIVVDGVPYRAVAPNAVIVVERLKFGPHEIVLVGVAENCSVTDSNRQTITIDHEGAVPLSFQIACVATGVLVRVVETGGDLDLTGYQVFVDNVLASYVGGNDAVTIGRMHAGVHSLALSNVAPNCAVAGENPRSVTINASTVIAVDFAVHCTAFSGTVDVNISSVGSELDLDGYVLQVDGANDRTVAPSQNLRLERVPAGLRTFRLTSISRHCSAPDNPRVVDLAIGQTVRVDFSVFCARGEKIAFSKILEYQASLVLVYDDGTNAKSLMGNAVEPSWSPDGNRLVFSALTCDYYYYYYYPDCRSVGLGVIDGDGRNARLITSGLDHDPSWNPDGSAIAFARSEQNRRGIRLLNMSDARLTELVLPLSVIDAFEPSWSPDGTRLAFSCVVNNTTNICVVNRDGSGFVQLTTGPYDSSPSWSPDGTRLAFVTNREAGPLRVAIMNADGTGVTTLVYGFDPAWSRDGTRIVFVSQLIGWGVYTMNADGTDVLRIAEGDVRAPSWRPK